ncbi:MAG: class I SAM-dependent methyltransferase, partial [Blastocatellia bacterium]
VLCDARYFMFFLSPLYLLSRMKPGIDRLTEAEKNALIERQHQTPSMPVNTVLSLLFGAETLVGHRLSFPWGTSILGVFRKP